MVRHERAGIKADMWSFGILVWELVSGMDITDMQSLAITRQMKVHLENPAFCQMMLLVVLSRAAPRHLFNYQG